MGNATPAGGLVEDLFGVKESTSKCVLLDAATSGDINSLRNGISLVSKEGIGNRSNSTLEQRSQRIFLYLTTPVRRDTGETALSIAETRNHKKFCHELHVEIIRAERNARASDNQR